MVQRDQDERKGQQADHSGDGAREAAMAEPLWRSTAEDLRQRIASGDLGRDGAPLPKELDLQEHYGVSRNTVRDAIKWLTARNIVVTRPGKGTFVHQRTTPFVTLLSNEIGASLGSAGAGYAREGKAYSHEIESQNRVPTETTPRVEIKAATGELASELRVEPGTSVVSRHQQRRIDDAPYSLQTTFYPMTLVAKGATRLIEATDIADGVVGYIQDTVHLRQVGWRDKIIVREADDDESDFFQLPDGGRIAVIETRRTGYDESGTPFRVTVTSYPADRNQFAMIAGKVPELAEEPVTDAKPDGEANS